MKNNDLIKITDDLLRKLILDGYFDEYSVELNSKRDTLTEPEYIYEAALSIVNTNYVNDRLIYSISNNFIMAYTKSLKVNSQKTIDILAEFIIGEKKAQLTENFSSYANYIIENRKISRMIKRLIVKNKISYSDKLNFGNEIATNYASSTELVSKIMISLLKIDKLIGKKPIDENSINKQATGVKLNTLKQSKSNDWSFFTELIDKNIRNAKSHLNLSYNPELELFIGKYYDRKTNSYKPIKIKMKEFLFMTNQIKAIITGFILSCYLLYLSKENKDGMNEIASIMDSKMQN